MPTQGERLRVIGAGIPRTGTTSLRQALELLLGGDCLHMSALPGHPFDLGPDWTRALDGGSVDWVSLLAGYRAAVDWPAAAFWQDIYATHPRAIVLLSHRQDAQVWLQSMETTVLPVARMALSADWQEGDALVRLLERFTGTDNWDSPEILTQAYDDHLANVRATVPVGQLIDWAPADGWDPICAALDLEVPAQPFPWTNRREDWG